MAEQIKPKSQTSAIATANKEITYQTSDGNKISLSNAMVRALTNNNPNVTDGEIELFIQLCKYQQLNPYIKEVYLVKYDEKKPAQQVTSLSAFMRIADENPKYDGLEDGIIVKTTTGTIIDRVGCVSYPNEMLLGGWARVYRTDRRIPSIARLALKEYTKNQATWSQSPATMINKCAKVSALRKAFPKAFSGLYSDEEIGIEQVPFEEIKSDTVYNIDSEPPIDLPTADFIVEDSGTIEVQPISQTTPMQENEQESVGDNAEDNNGEDGDIFTVSYADYKNNLYKYEKIADTYDKASSTIKVRLKEE